LSLIKTICKNIPDLGYNGGLFTVAPDFGANFPMARFTRDAYSKAVSYLSGPPTKFGVHTPLALGMKSLDNVLNGLSGRTAAILFSDGGENRGGKPSQVCNELSRNYDVCFHVVSYAQSQKEKRVINRIVNSQDCSTQISGEAFHQDEDSRLRFIQNIFYTTNQDTDGDGVFDYEDECPGTPAGASVNVRGCALDSDNDGVIDYRDECPGTPAEAVVDDKGCPLDSDGDGVYDYEDKCMNTPKGASTNASGCWIVEDLQFETGKAEIRATYYNNLNEIVTILKQNPGIAVEIQGHTDSQGSAKMNRRLSERRALAVKDYLVGKGVDEDRLSYEGYGEEKPIASNDTAQGRAKNRRVEIKALY